MGEKTLKIFLLRLIQAGGDIKKAERGIIYVDEN